NAWIADRNWGLVRAYNFTEFTSLVPDGPASDNAASISAGSGKIFICSGGTDDHWNGTGRPFGVSVFENGRFGNITLSSFRNAMRACPDPGNDHLFVSSWGDGLFEFSGNKLISHYNNTNSPLNGSGPGGVEIRTCGLTFDRAGNLWVTNTGGTLNILILKPDGSWVTYPATVEAPVMGDITTTSSGQKWILLPGGNGLFIIDDNNTPYIFSDDRTRRLTIRDTEGNIISNSFSLAEDLDGNIWVGTDQGPVIYSNTGRIFDEDPRCSRIKVPRNDGSGLADYMLGTETITSIAVDGANRKWLGTAGSGAYLLSADGTELVKNYNEKNSPVFSDSISSLSIDSRSGEVWIGTTQGILSVREVATAGSDGYISVYSFPNPVREDFTGNVTITGLMRDTEIKITDVSGNLVFKTMSEGGQASWDLTTYTGHRVTTGVYLVFCSNSDGSRSYVTKILVIGR
ncbi:MAG: T9SS type A sorting domain-containing protein, partial [Bacteroidales bacterium]